MLLATGATALFALASSPSPIRFGRQPGDQSASATIEDLEAQGYNVQINWVNGNISQPLSQCSVSAIHNPNRSA